GRHWGPVTAGAPRVRGVGRPRAHPAEGGPAGSSEPGEPSERRRRPGRVSGARPSPRSPSRSVRHRSADPRPRRAGLCADLPAVARSGFRGTYVDANAVAPATVEMIASTVAANGATFVDGDLIGGPPQPGGPTRLYLSGDAASSVAGVLTGPGLESVVVEGDIT